MVCVEDLVHWRLKVGFLRMLVACLWKIKSWSQLTVDLLTSCLGPLENFREHPNFIVIWNVNLLNGPRFAVSQTDFFQSQQNLAKFCLKVQQILSSLKIEKIAWRMFVNSYVFGYGCTAKCLGKIVILNLKIVNSLFFL